MRPVNARFIEAFNKEVQARNADWKLLFPPETYIGLLVVLDQVHLGVEIPTGVGTLTLVEGNCLYDRNSSMYDSDVDTVVDATGLDRAEVERRWKEYDL